MILAIEEHELRNIHHDANRELHLATENSHVITERIGSRTSSVSA
mgnify:CR=1 FL=1